MSLLEIASAYIEMDSMVYIMQDDKKVFEGTFEQVQQSEFSDEYVYNMQVDHNVIIVEID